MMKWKCASRVIVARWRMTRDIIRVIFRVTQRPFVARRWHASLFYVWLFLTNGGRSVAARIKTRIIYSGLFVTPRTYYVPQIITITILC